MKRGDIIQLPDGGVNIVGDTSPVNTITIKADFKPVCVAFANFVGNRPLSEYSESINKWRWWNNDTREYNFATTEQLFDIFIKQYQP